MTAGTAGRRERDESVAVPFLLVLDPAGQRKRRRQGLDRAGQHHLDGRPHRRHTPTVPRRRRRATPVPRRRHGQGRHMATHTGRWWSRDVTGVEPDVPSTSAVEVTLEAGKLGGSGGSAQVQSRRSTWSGAVRRSSRRSDARRQGEFRASSGLAATDPVPQDRHVHPIRPGRHRPVARWRRDQPPGRPSASSSPALTPPPPTRPSRPPPAGCVAPPASFRRGRGRHRDTGPSTPDCSPPACLDNREPDPSAHPTSRSAPPAVSPATPTT